MLSNDRLNEILQHCDVSGNITSRSTVRELVAAVKAAKAFLESCDKEPVKLNSAEQADLWDSFCSTCS